MLNPHVCVGLLFIGMRSSGLGWINLILPLMCLCSSIQRYQLSQQTKRICRSILYLKFFKKIEKVTFLFRRKHFIISVVANKYITNKEQESDFNFTAKAMNIFNAVLLHKSLLFHSPILQCFKQKSIACRIQYKFTEIKNMQNIILMRVCVIRNHMQLADRMKLFGMCLMTKYCCLWQKQ